MSLITMPYWIAKLLVEIPGSSGLSCPRHLSFAVMKARGLCGLYGYNRFSYGSEGEASEFEVLQREGDADDRYGARQRRSEMPNREPNAKYDKPYDVSQCSECTGTNVTFGGQILSVNCFASEGKKGESADDKARASPRNSDNRDECQRPCQPPCATHEETTKYKPQKIPALLKNEWVKRHGG
jgi:hypothetical protein